MKKIIALAVAAVVAAPAMADLTIGASARYQIDNGANTAADETSATTNRILVSFAGSTTAESGLFVSAGATLQIAADDATNDTGVDGNNNIVVGNEMANVALGYTESAGVYAKGADAFRVAPAAGLQERILGRHSDTVILNVTAVEGLTAQLTGYLTNDSLRAVVGYDFGSFAVKAGFDNADDDLGAGEDAMQLMASTDLGGVAVTASYADMDATDAQFVNVGASYMGFSLNYETAEVAGGADSDALYGAYAVANVAGLDGLNVTVGAGSADNADTKVGVRLDYAF